MRLTGFQLPVTFYPAAETDVKRLARW
jgi:hypothetical protein